MSLPHPRSTTCRLITILVAVFVTCALAPARATAQESSGESEVALYQETMPEAATGEEAGEPAPVEETASEPVPVAEEWVEPEPVVDDVIDEAPAEEWVEPAPPEDSSVDPAPAEELVAPASAPAEEVSDTSSSTNGVEPWSEPIATAYIAGANGDGVVCRTGPDRGTDKLAVLAVGEAVEVRGEAVGEWLPVNCAGVGGYVNTSLISWEPAAAPVAAPVEERGADPGSDTAAGSGQAVTDFAMQYVGYPYVNAGEGPEAFDCSGFTKFVIQNALGIDITHDMFTQIEMGQSVGRNELQPGDLVFFADTFRPGLSHVGIYTGGGQFVHAENESTGVRVSDLNSDYYGSRWYGGARYT